MSSKILLSVLISKCRRHFYISNLYFNCFLAGKRMRYRKQEQLVIFSIKIEKNKIKDVIQIKSHLTEFNPWVEK